MDLRRLRYFVAVAEEGHMTRAAEALYLSQPALSQQIAALERELGTPLFDRIGRGLELTAAGAVLRDHAVRILRQVEDARAAIDDLRGTVRGELTVSTIQTANVAILVEVISRFRELHPGVVVRVREERTEEVQETVRRGGANIGLSYLPPGPLDRLEVMPLYTEELVLVVPRGHRLAGRSLPTREVAALPLVVPPGGYCLRGGIDAALEEAGGRQRVVAEITAIEGLCEAVRAGVGLTILPSEYITPRAEQAGLATARLVDPVPRRKVGAIRSAERHACTATRAFLAALNDFRVTPADSARLTPPAA